MAVADYTTEVLADGPLGYWVLDETSGTVAADSSGNGRDGTYNGLTLATRTVAGFTSPDFASSGYVSLPAIDVGQSPWTLEAVCRADVVHGAQGIVLTSREAASSRVTAAIGTYVANDGYFGQLAGGGYYGGGAWALAKDGALAVDTDTHLAYVFDGSTGRLYVDGVEVATVATAGEATTNIGWDIGTNHTRAHYWNGTIAGVVLHPTALSAVRVADHYDALVAAPGAATAAVSFTGTGTVSFTAEPDPVTAAVSFTGSATVSFTAEPDPATAAVSFTGTATLTVAQPTIGDIDTAAVSFTGTATFEAVTRPVGRRRRIVATAMGGAPVAELESALAGPISWVLNERERFAFQVPLTDPKATLLLDQPYREIQMWRGDQLLAWGPAVRVTASKTSLTVAVEGVLWYLSRRHIGKASRTNYITNGDFEDGTTGWRVGALHSLEPLATRSTAYWTATTPTARALTGTHALQLEQLATGAPKYGVSASQTFLWDVDPVTNPEGDHWSLVARCFIPSADWRGPPPDGTGIRLERYSTTETIDLTPDGGGPTVTLPKLIEAATATIDETTPRDIWTRLEATMTSPVTGDPEWITVALNCPDGSILFDRAALSLDEAERYWGVDQSAITAGLLAHLQDADYGKSDLNLTADMPLTGIKRDRTYLHHEHGNGLDALTEFCDLENGMDLSVALTPTDRIVRTHHPARGTYRPRYRLELGSTVTDYSWAFDGEAAANTVIVLGTGDGSDREEASASNPDAFTDGLTLEMVYSAPPDTPIDSLDDVAAETLTVATGPDVLSVTTAPPHPGWDPIGIVQCGDTLPVAIRAGALTVEGDYRVVALTLNADDTLNLTLNRRGPTP